MKEINGNSWHWKLTRKYNHWFGEHISLCKYFWTVVWCSIRRVVEATFSYPVRPLVLGVLIFYCYVVPMYLFINVALVSGIDPNNIEGVVVGFMIIGFFEFIISLVLIGLGITALIGKYGVDNGLVSGAVDKVKKTETVQLVTEYVKAKKSKICPLLKTSKYENGWHWKLTQKYNYWFGENVSLCKYFGTVVWCCIRRIFETIFSYPVRPLVLGTLIFYCYIVPMYVFVTFAPGASEKIYGLVGALLIIGGLEFILSICAIFLGFIYVISEYVLKNGLADRAVDRVMETETVQLVTEYVKAKKRKICPLLKTPNYR